MVPKDGENQLVTIFVSLLRRKQSQCPHMAAVYCYANESDKPKIAEREDAIEPARVLVVTGCEYKLFVNTSGGRFECDGTIYVDAVRAHGSMRIGTILPHLSCRHPCKIQICLVPSVGGQRKSVKAIMETTRVIKCKTGGGEGEAGPAHQKYRCVMS